jgi:hypothetical protein
VAIDGLAQGQTMMRRKQISYPQAGWSENIPDTHVCMKVDSAACTAMFENTLMSPWLNA